MGLFDFIGDIFQMIPNTIDAVGGIVTNNKNIKAQKEANAQNIALQQETNAQNYQMFRESQDFSREMYQRQLADQWDMIDYNSASNQRKRLEAAGLNPYMMMSGSNAGTAGSVPSASSPSYSPAQAPKVNPVLRQFLGGFQLSNLAESVLRMQDQKADIRGKEIENQYRSTKNALDLAQRVANIRGMNENTKGKAIQNLFDGMSFNARLASTSMQPQFLEKQIRSLELQNICQELKIPYISQYAQAEIDKMVSEAALNWQRKNDGKRLTDAQVKLFYEQALKTERERLNLPPMTAKQTERLADAMVSTAENTVDLGSFELGQASYDAGKRTKLRESSILQGLDIAGDLILPWK